MTEHRDQKSRKLTDLEVVKREGLAALCVGSVIALSVPSAAIGRIDEALVTFLSIIAGFGLPGMALTAAAPRPPAASPLEAAELGRKLERQVRFWFGFIAAGVFAVVTVLVGRAANWELVTPRPEFIPDFVPIGSSWLVLISATAIVFAGIRLRHVVGAVLSLVRLGTTANAAQALDRHSIIHAEVAEKLRLAPRTDDRGAPLPSRDRH